jgi:hypothetical protein
LISWWLVGRESLSESLLIEVLSEILSTWPTEIESQDRPAYLFVCPEVWDETEPETRSFLESSASALRVELISAGDLTPQATFPRQGASAVMVCFRTLRRGPFLRQVEIFSGSGSRIGYGYSRSELRLFVFGKWMKARSIEEKFIL